MHPDTNSPPASAWAERLNRFRTADMTVAQFCSAEGVSQASYFYWQRKILGRQKVDRKATADIPPQFVPVDLAEQASQRPATVMAVDLPGGIRIRFEVASDPSEART